MRQLHAPITGAAEAKFISTLSSPQMPTQNRHKAKMNSWEFCWKPLQVSDAEAAFEPMV